VGKYGTEMRPVSATTFPSALVLLSGPYTAATLIKSLTFLALYNTLDLFGITTYVNLKV
jgi:hypothetical protein